MDERPTPKDADIPGGFPATPSELSLGRQTPTGVPANGSPAERQNVEDTTNVDTPTQTRNETPSYFPPTATPAPSRNVEDTTNQDMPSRTRDEATSSSPAATTTTTTAVAAGAAEATGATTGHSRDSDPSSSSTLPVREEKPKSPEWRVSPERRPSKQVDQDVRPTTASTRSHSSLSSLSTDSDEEMRPVAAREDSKFEPIKTPATKESQKRPNIGGRQRSIKTEEDLFRVLSTRRTSATGKTQEELEEEGMEIEKLLTRMFGKARQEHSEEEKTRHSGVVFRDLTVKGVGLGASLQPTVGDIFLGLPRTLKNLFTKGAKAASGKPPVREIISGFNGCVRPGEMLLVLGRPGAGCSTFLKAFCNQRSGFEAVEGNVSYGGTDAKRMAKDFRGEVIYNPEDDLHYATLTVRRTLRFALQTRTPGKESRLEGESRADYMNEFLRVVTKLFWIEHTLGTKVGDEFIRGVSGGERKRVSIAEAMITRASVQGWDNSSKGLDASTALEYVQSIRTMTNMAHTSCAVSLYQAGENLYSLVDKVLLIDAGQCVFFGPAEDAKEYFLNLGYDCPDRWTTADFLTSVTDEHERSIRKGWENRVPRTAEEFADAYRKSDIYQKNLQDMADFESHVQEQVEARQANRTKKNKRHNYTIPFHKQVIACTKRQFLVMIGDRASLFGKWGGLVFQGLIVGSLFWQMPDTAAGAFPRGGTLFFLLLFNALLALAEMTSAFQSKPILLKHKSFSFYRPAAYAIAQTVVDIPLIFIQVFIFTVIIYWMGGLAATPSQFFISILILWLVTMTTYAFFRAIAALCGTLDVATRFTGVSIQVLIVYTGYLIPPSSMHPWFAWLRWINWIQYGFECLMANEFTGLDLQCVPPYLVPQGPGVQQQHQSCTLAGSRPGSTIVNGADYIQTSFTYTRSHLWRNFGFLWAFFFAFVVLTMVGMERMQPNSGGAAVTMFKRGQVPRKIEETIETGGREKKDEETGPTSHIGEKQVVDSSDSSDKDEDKTMANLAKNETVFTFQNINYNIPYEKGTRQLLNDVQGYVRPGKLTALMGASGK